MTEVLVLIAAALSALLLSGPAAVLLRRLRTEDTLTTRVAVARGAPVVAARPAKQRVATLQLITTLGSAIVRSGLLSERTLKDLEQTLVAGGFRTENALGLFVGCKLLLLVGLAAATFLVLPPHMSPLFRNLVIGGVGGAGLLVPDYLVRRVRNSYRAKLERGLPDALDMLVICAQGGLGLQPAIKRVSEEVGHAHPEVADEFARTASEMQVMADNRVALLRLGERTGMDSIRRLTATLAQSIQYGTPLSDAMRSLAAEMRQEMLTSFEERAGRLPVFLTMPMIMFILPCVLMVAGGPAVIQLFKALSH